MRYRTIAWAFSQCRQAHESMSAPTSATPRLVRSWLKAFPSPRQAPPILARLALLLWVLLSPGLLAAQAAEPNSSKRDRPARTSQAQTRHPGEDSAKSPAQTDDKSARDLARDLGKQGLAALDAQDFAQAEEHLSGAIHLYPAPTLYVARAKARIALGKLVAAKADLMIVEEIPEAHDEPPAFVAARKFAEAQHKALDQRIAQLTIKVDGTPTEVRINGTVLGGDKLGEPQALDPGPYTIEAARGETVDEAKVVLEEGQDVVVQLALPLGKAGSAQVTLTESQPASATAAGDGDNRWALYMAGAVTLGLGVSAAIVGGLYLAQREDFHEFNRTDAPTSEKQLLRDEAQSLGYVGTGLLAGTVLGGIVTTYMLISQDGDDASDEAARVRVQPFGLGGLEVSGRF